MELGSIVSVGCVDSGDYGGGAKRRKEVESFIGGNPNLEVASPRNLIVGPPI